MKVRYRVALEIIIEGQNFEEIEAVFEWLDMGRIKSAENVIAYDFIETEAINMVKSDGTVGRNLM
jgi:hypothetical protein